MFIETLEFTIPVELCNVFSNLQRGQKSNVEFPASVNSYGTTQDANVQVVLRSNKLTFKVDGVSSNASMISKSECKTLKLSVFDVDHSLMPNEEEEQYSYNNDMPTVQHSVSIPISNPAKRLHEQSVSLPPAKSSRTSYSESPRPRSPTQRRRSQPHISPRPSENSHSKSQNDTPVNVKQEPEDPDLIEIEPDDVVPKKETPYMQIDYSSDVPHTQTSQAALERLSHHQSSHSQSPASSSSSFHRNVPHVPDYSEPGPSHDQHGDQSADDFLVFQEQDENEDCDDNDVDYGNDDNRGSVSKGQGCFVTYTDQGGKFSGQLAQSTDVVDIDWPLFFDKGDGKGLVKSIMGNQRPLYPCEDCGKMFTDQAGRRRHREANHDKVTHSCVCGGVYMYRGSLQRHQKHCSMFMKH